MRGAAHGVLLALLAASTVGAGEQWPQLRHTCYAVVLAPEGSSIHLGLKSIAKGTYPDWLQYAIIDGNGDEVLWDQLRPGSQGEVEYPVRTPGLHVIELVTGWNVATLAVGDMPSALVVSERLPLQTVGEVPRLYFYVPAGVTEFVITGSASVTGEGARLTVSGPDANEAGVLDGDLDKPEKLTLRVSPGQDARVWSFAITSPQTPNVYVDDVLLHFSENIPPYVAETAEAAETFARMGEQQ